MALNELLENHKNIHTTDLGLIRIKRNLQLETDDVVNWCVEKIAAAESIVRKGKNWYVDVGDAVITINAYSYTIITAHKK